MTTAYGECPENDSMLKVKLLNDHAIAPTVAHPGEDLGYDLYSSEDGVLPAHGFKTFCTGVACEFLFETEPELKFGFIAKERSSQAKRGINILGGCIDAGYRGEIHLMLGSFANEDIEIKAG